MHLKLLFEYWNLEPLYVQILKGLDFEDEYSPKIASYIDSLDVIRTAVNPKNILTKESIKEAAELVEDIGLDPEHFTKVASRVREQYNKTLINRMRKK